MSPPRRWRVLAAGGFAAAAVTAMVVAAPTPASAVPATPAGWTLVFADDFNGAADTGSTPNWLYDLGTGYPGGAANWGTGEIENDDQQHRQRLPWTAPATSRIKPIRDARRQLDLGPHRDPAHRLRRRRPAASCGSRPRIQQPNVTGAAAAGYWPAFWMLGAAGPAGRRDRTGRASARSTSWRTSTGAAPCSPPCTAAPTPGGPCNETTGLGSGERRLPRLPDRLPHLRRGVGPQHRRRSRSAWYLDGANFFTVNANQVDATTWNNATHHGFFIILNVAIGGGFPAAFGGGPTASTASGVPMLVDYVAVYTAGGGDDHRRPRPAADDPAADRRHRDAYGTIQAESFNAQSGTQLEATTDTGGGQNIGWHRQR